MNTFHLVISSVGETLFDGAASSATLPGADGELTILAHHEPFVTTLTGGTISVRRQDEEPKEFVVRGGVLEFSGNQATVLL